MLDILVKIPPNKKTKAFWIKGRGNISRAQGQQSATVTWIKQKDSNSAPIPSPYKVNTGLILIHHMTTMCIKGRSTSTIATKGDIKDQFHILEVLRFAILRRFRFQVCFFFPDFLVQEVGPKDFHETLGFFKKKHQLPLFGRSFLGFQMHLARKILCQRRLGGCILHWLQVTPSYHHPSWNPKKPASCSQLFSTLNSQPKKNHVSKTCSVWG